MKRKLLFSGMLLFLATLGWAQQKHFKLPSISLSDPPTISSGIVPDTGHMPVLVRAINIFGNRKTKDPLVEREIAVKTGVLYAPRELFKLIRLTREQLMNTSLFVTVDIAIDTLLPDELDINIVVRERWYLFPIPYFKIVDRNINVWINEYKASLDRTDYGIKIIHNNLSGRNDKLNLFVIGGYSQQIMANYYQPFIDKKLRQGLGFGVSMARAREVNYATDSNKQQFYSLPEFARTTLRAELTYSYRKGSQMRAFAKMSYTSEEMDSTVIGLNPNMFGDGRNKAEYVDIFGNYQYLNLDYIPYPLRGWMVDLYALKRISASIPMFQIGGKMQATWRFMPKTYLNFQGAFAVTFSDQQPYYNSRMLGYRSLYMQGLEYYVADGTMAGMIRTTLRREVLAFTLNNLVRSKSHSKIPFKFFLKGYGNLGYAYQENPGTNYMNNQLLRTAGFGLDIQMIYDMVLKLEYSYNQFGERGFYIHTATDF